MLDSAPPPHPSAVCESEPQEHYDDGSCLADRLLALGRHPRVGLYTTVLDDLRRQQPDSEPYQRRQQKRVVDVSENGNEVGN